MTIEFRSPLDQVEEWVLDYARQKLTELQHANPHISRAEVDFFEQPGIPKADYGCGIELTVYGDSLYTRRNSESYIQALTEVLTDLEARVKEQVLRDKDVPDEITSTVKP